jgi:hypothetical protein
VFASVSDHSPQDRTPLLRKVACKPWFSGATAIVGTLAGFLAAIYADQIRSAFPFFLGLGPIEWHAAITWAALALFGLMFGLNSWALTAATDHQLKELRSNTVRLQELIRTLPPEEFLSDFQKYLSICFPIATKGSGVTASQAEVREGIVSILSSLAYMVNLFERSSQKCEYSANIMIFRSFSGLDAVQIKDFEQRAKFTERQGAGGDSWSGVLELIPSLAVFLKDGVARPDSKRLPRFVLEIPLTEYRVSGGKSAVLPGAPEAFCEGSYTFIPDTFNMGAECRKKRALRHSVADSMDSYFRDGEGKDIRSFISIPIFAPGATATQEPIAVVNIHNDLETMFQRSAFELFVPFTAPHTLLLSHLLENFLKISPDAHI